LEGSSDEPKKGSTYSLDRTLKLFGDRTFLVVIALRFTLTLLRETFNFWTVDFIRTEGGAQVSSKLAAFLSTPFDLCGAAGIVLMGWVFGRLQPKGRQWLLVVILGSLSLLLVLLPELFHFGLWTLAAGVGAIGFLVYGPYSLLGGVLSVEVRGKEFAATVSGLVDGTGYFAGVLSGTVFGRLLMKGGYRLGFEAMAGLTLIAAILCCFLYRKSTALEGSATDVQTPAPALSDNP
jgi:sugar phosphate permease